MISLPTYKYVAVNLQKKKYKGIFIADDEKDLAVQLTKQNLYLVSATVYKSATPNAFFTLGTGKVSLTELTTFCRQFAIMLDAGIHLTTCLDNLKLQSFSSYFRSILRVITEDVKAGAMLSEALEKHKKVFPEFFRSMVHVGEASGRLETVFRSLADYYETDTSTRRKIKAALAYPLILAVMTLGIVFLMLMFVIPTFRDALSRLDIELSGLTKAVYDVSDFFLSYGLYLLSGLLLLALFTFLFSRTKKGKQVFDVLKVKLPLIGRIQVNMLTARFARSMSILLASGMDLSTALDTISGLLGNTYMEARFAEASEDIRQGVSLTAAFSKQRMFPPILIQMLSVGEQTASLDEVLGRSCKFFDEQVEASLSSLTAKIQPTMLIIMGAVIGTLFLAVYSPMLSIMNGLSVGG